MAKVVRKQGLIIGYNIFLNENERRQLTEKILRQMREDGVVLLPKGYNITTVDMDYVVEVTDDA